MGRLTFIIGGARSGKSSLAQEIAGRHGRRVAFVATGQARDVEMHRRIVRHTRSRPRHWKTFEEPREVAKLLKKISGDFDCIIIDCVTLLLSNLLLEGTSPASIEKEIRGICLALQKSSAEAVVVSNEVGWGIVPENALARRFRDLSGRANQIFAKEAHEVTVMFCGVPVTITKKGSK